MSRCAILHFYLVAFSLVIFTGCGRLWSDTSPRVTIGSKKFTESVILGELLKHLLRSEDIPTRHIAELGGTQIVFSALERGDVDAYVEYTGTLSEEIFAGQGFKDIAAIEAELAQRGIRMSRPLGFNNTYAIAMKPEVAERLGIRTISDLRDHPDLRFGFNNEFMDRGDGWPSLRVRYQLPQQNVRGLDHDLAYRALAAGDIDVVDAYSTDAEIDYYGLTTLEDDLEHFPRYDAVVLYRDNTAEIWPKLAAAIESLAGEIDETEMARMNGRARLDGEAEARVAADFLGARREIDVDVRVRSKLEQFGRYTAEHLFLVGVSLSAAVLLAVPIGIVAARVRRLGESIIGAVGIVQTIPSLAMLVFMIPLLGIGAKPAIAALFLYSLLPIVRNTYAGLHGITPALLESADALGLPRGARLRLIELPMASRTILAGIKTAAVINVGTATLGALIGAGGYGQPILTGIRRDDMGLILEGAIPAALLALLAQGLFELAERRLVPKGLRLQSGT